MCILVEHEKCFNAELFGKIWSSSHVVFSEKIDKNVFARSKHCIFKDLNTMITNLKPNII